LGTYPQHYAFLWSMNRSLVMAMIGVRIASLGLALALSWPSPQASAFGIRLGPFILFGGRAHHHVHHRYVVRRPTEALRRPTEALQNPTEALHSKATLTQSVAQNRPPSLLYPVVAWPFFVDGIFRPTNHSSWPFNYQGIFDQAFAEYPAKRVAELCPRRLGESDADLGIGREIVLTDRQRPLLQALSTALAQANGYLIKSCPAAMPPLPVERLQLMHSQIDATIMALEIVRVPLQKFEQSLDDRQRAALSARVTSEDTVRVCTKNLEPAKNWPMPILRQALQPSTAQEAALNGLERAFNRAASELNTDCSDGIPRMPSARLQAIEARLDTTWVAVQTIEVAVAQFQKQLSDEQRARFDTLQLAATP